MYFARNHSDSNSAESDQDDDSAEESSQPQSNGQQAVQPTKLMESKSSESQQAEDEDKSDAKVKPVRTFYADSEENNCNLLIFFRFELVSMQMADAEGDDELIEDKVPEDKDSDSLDSRILQVGRAAYGRSIITPVNIPVEMVQKEETRPHYVQPRSIREN